MPIATLRELLGELDRALAYTEDLQVGLTPEQDRGDLPPLSRIREHRSVVAERLHHRIGQIDRGAVGAPNQLRVIASTLLVALVNHEYQHSKWIGEVRTFGLEAPPLPPRPDSASSTTTWCCLTRPEGS